MKAGLLSTSSLHYPVREEAFPWQKLTSSYLALIISSTEWFIVCGNESKEEENYISAEPGARSASTPLSWKSSRQTIMSAVIDLRSLVSPPVKPLFKWQSALPAPQMLSNEAVHLYYYLLLNRRGKMYCMKPSQRRFAFLPWNRTCRCRWNV